MRGGVRQVVRLATLIAALGSSAALAQPAPPVRGDAMLVHPDPLAVVYEPLDRALRQHPPIGVAVYLAPSVTTVAQDANRTALGASGQVSTRYNLYTVWVLWKDPTIGSGVLAGALRGVRNIGSPAERNLTQNVMAASDVNHVWQTYEVALRTLWWRMESPSGRFQVNVGKVDPTDYFDTSAVANTEETQFLNGGLTNNAAIPFPGGALGTVLQVKGDRWGALLGTVDAQGLDQSSGFGTIGEGGMLSLAELDLYSNLPIGGERYAGTYRAMLWGTTLADAEGVGVALSVDQHLPRAVIPFLRVGWAERRAFNPNTLPFEWFVSAGVGVHPSGREYDLFGLGFTYGDSPHAALGTQAAVETFWRLQVTHSVELSPDLQLVWQPATGDDPVVIPGLRLRLAF